MTHIWLYKYTYMVYKYCTYMGSTITHIWVQVYDYRYMITGIWLQVYDCRHMIEDIWFQTYDMMTDIWLQTYDTHIWLSSKTLCLQTYDHIPPYMVFTYMILVHVYGTHICVCRHMIHIYVYLFPWDVLQLYWFSISMYCIRISNYFRIRTYILFNCTNLDSTKYILTSF